MPLSVSKFERRKIIELAREYKRRGYEVNSQPRSGDLPSFFGKYVPDLIAKNENESIAIEVKSRTTLKQSSWFSEFARRVEKHPGWRLELVVTNPADSHKLELNLNDEEIEKRLSDAYKLLSRQSNDAAILLAWSAAEAVLRAKAEEAGTKIPPSQARFAIKFLFSRGGITKKEFEELDRMFLARSRIIHGYKSSEFSDKSVMRFIHSIRNLHKSKD